MLVIDASIALAWLLERERNPFGDGLLEKAASVELWAPSLWPLEVANALLVAERRGRIDRTTRLEALERLAALGIRIDAAVADLLRISDLAERRGLSAFDAVYLELALRRGFELATFDRDLAAAAAAEGVAVHAPAQGSAAQRRQRYRARAQAAKAYNS
ncbi:MAG: type II toxin-antitoxin system VapC family toxin [Burkholderiales bacterium]|nr:type II toxin-antitoxin system VapC family toxin [Burkholderiales bacterium]